MASTEMSQADLVKLAKRYGIDTTAAAIGRKTGHYSLGRQELVEQIIESADPGDLAEITRTLEIAAGLPGSELGLPLARSGVLLFNVGHLKV